MFCIVIMNQLLEFSHNTQSWQHWRLIQIHQKYSRKEKEVIFSQNPNKNIYTRLFWGKLYLVYIIHKDFQKKMTSFSFFKYFDAFELDVNVVNFVYYGKTQLSIYKHYAIENSVSW